VRLYLGTVSVVIIQYSKQVLHDNIGSACANTFIMALQTSTVMLHSDDVNILCYRH
jgi:hypothetical protein